MGTNQGYPALRALFARAFAGVGTRKAMERLANVPPGEAPVVAAEIRELLAAVRAERDLGSALAGLGCAYDPRRDGDTARSWLGGLMRHCERVHLQREHGNYDGVTGDALRPALAAEIARIGVDELSVRTMVPRDELLKAVRGEEVGPAARRSLSVYRFGRYPDLEHLLGGYFHQDWMDFHPSWQEVVDEFASEQRPGLVRGVLVDIERLLQADDAAFDLSLRAVGGEKIPAPRSEWRAWLAEARDRILARIPS